MSTHEITQAALDQLDHHWTTQLRPRLDGLTDDEYRWEPVAGAWNVHPMGTGATPMAAGAGDIEIDFAFPEPTPPPVTTIAWRLGHVIVGVLAMRNADHFGHPETSYQAWDYAGTADGALDQLDEQYARWVAGVHGLDVEALARPCHEGEPGGPYFELPMLDLVLHINREVIHHGAEIALLRDLYAHR
ncbi:DinB family protein [Mariniluteicoccus flavus]